MVDVVLAAEAWADDQDGHHDAQQKKKPMCSSPSAFDVNQIG